SDVSYYDLYGVIGSPRAGGAGGGVEPGGVRLGEVGEVDAGGLAGGGDVADTGTVVGDELVERVGVHRRHRIDHHHCAHQSVPHSDGCASASSTDGTSSATSSSAIADARDR